MTCYETLRASAPAADAPMAHHFVKWWRNKFRNGYKKFSFGAESERTDTEELVGRAASQCSAPPDLLPSEARVLLQPSGQPPHLPRTSRIPEDSYKSQSSPTHLQENNDDKHPRLRFEELTCDVELQHPEPSKQQPLQFSFTLYDLDGHGRMTKDDIAGIVSTIYESIGKSVIVPHYGSKTIQVRLTVVPENSNRRNHRDRREGQQRRRRKEYPQVVTPPAPDCVDHTDDEDRDRLSGEEDLSSKSSCSEERRPNNQERRSNAYNPARMHRHKRRDHRERKHMKKRSGSLQRRELLEIIQANMEKNHQSFQPSRKPCDSIANEDDYTIKYQKLRNRSHTVNEKPTIAFQKVKSDNSGNGYLDLASGGDSHLCRYDRYLHAVICSSAKHANTGYHQKQNQSSRPPRVPHYNYGHSRIHDPPGQPQGNHQPRVLQIIFL